MTDKDIIDFFSDKNGKIKPSRTTLKYLDKHANIKYYLENRYNEFISYVHTIRCIFNGLNEIPKCETCGNILTNIYATYCSDKCRANGYSYKEKIKNYYINLYGVENPAQAEEIKEKIKATNLERYGVVNVYQSKDIIQKCKDTKLKSYSDSNYNNRNKASQTCLNRYNVSTYVQSKKFVETRKRKYYLDDMGFDSIPEVAFYVYHRDLGHKIVQEPIQLEYKYDNKKHIYNPDFEVDGQLYEIKGKHFFENDKMINPFDRSQDDLYEAKHQCMLKNNVIIISDFDDYLEYFYSHDINKTLIVVK